MSARRNRKRPYGTGSLLTHRGAWYGQWRVGERQVKRKLGEKRVPGSRVGLTRKQAEALLRRRIQEERVAPIHERLTVAEAGERYISHVEVVRQRKATTVSDYRSILRHLVRYFGSRSIDRLRPDDLAGYLTHSLALGRLSPKTISNHLSFASGLFSFAVKRGWAATNPVAAVDRPRPSGPDPDIRFLTPTEVEALVRAVPDDLLGPTDRTLYLTAAMTGLRQGELFALRWRDVDWVAGAVRVRRNFTRGRFGSPKSRRSNRSVPMADRVARALERHFQTSRYLGDEDLVLCHPHTGRPYDASKARRRFKRALDAADLRPIRFHDLRHTFGTSMAAVGVPMRTLQELMGHRDFKTTLIYADYSPNPSGERAWAERAFGNGRPGHPSLASEGLK